MARADLAKLSPSKLLAFQWAHEINLAGDSFHFGRSDVEYLKIEQVYKNEITEALLQKMDEDMARLYVTRRQPSFWRRLRQLVALLIWPGDSISVVHLKRPNMGSQAHATCARRPGPFEMVPGPAMRKPKPVQCYNFTQHGRNQ